MSNLVGLGYYDFLRSLKEKIASARISAYQSVSRHLVDLYLYLGKSIHEKIELSRWGEGVVEKLAGDLQNAFPDMKGFSTQNLWRMKQVYEIYKDNKNLSPLVRVLPWTHNMIIIHSATTIEENEFYLKTCVQEKWTKRELERQIESGLYERFMLSKKTKGVVPASKAINKINHFKDEYALDFLGLKDLYLEKDLQKAIIANLKQFILELGKHFTFIGEEYKINIGGEDFKVDLLFYHRVMRCLVAIELKIGKFKPEYIGKMQFYLTALDEKEKLATENPSVGLILCKTKNDEAVRIAVSKAVSPMKVATYKTKIINIKLLQKKLHSLPMPEQN